MKKVTPEQIGMSSEELSKLEGVINTEYRNLTGIVIARKGQLAYEHYLNGVTAKAPQKVASVTKSVISALIGIAIDQGLIESVDQKVLAFFPEYIVHPAEIQKKAVTIKHLLTMTAPYAFRNYHEPFERLCRQPDWGKFTLDLLGKNGQIGAFKYATSGAHLLSIILTKATGKSAREFANEFLFKPIGMREIPDYKMTGFGYEELFGEKVRGWVKDPQGHTTGGWGLTTTAQDMARFGMLYLNQGKWEGKQIISKEWVQDSIKMTPHHYGYLWWLEAEPFETFAALGDGGNMIYCVPKEELVVAITSDFIRQPKDRIALVKDYILPAILTE
ncbi:serine hydrolase domain-containing protein [Isobaculum melis]|uniref:CubicO group peptidase, beta-lactamase class C family n=1 Tax=Isobaculum melis TaxID=142588 RepID=A0A1H9QTS7_9LACT|nr:serine hydrolase [Isobaculum melis]SER63830.1 CubicO group peptidase, beta-lactamase class C family [Isobaculum melis]